MPKRISQITTTRSTPLLPTDKFEGEQVAGGLSFQIEVVNMLKGLPWGHHTPSAITANQNSYDQVNSRELFIRLSSDAEWELRSFPAGQAGEMHLLLNVGVENIKLMFNHASGSDKKLNMSETDDFLVMPGGLVLTWYDAVLEVWWCTALNSRVVISGPPSIVDLDGTPTYLQFDDPILLDTGVTLFDSFYMGLNGSQGNWAGAQLTVARQGGANSADTFSFNSGGSLTVAGGNISAGGNVIATWTSTSGTLTVTFQNAGTIPTTALVNEVVQAIRFRIAETTDFADGSITLEYTIDDGVDTASDTIVVTLEEWFIEDASPAFYYQADRSTHYSDAGVTVVTTDGSLVRRFNDVRNNGLYMQAPADNQRGTIQTNELNTSLPVLRFDGSNDVYVSGATMALTGFAVITAYKMNSASAAVLYEQSVDANSNNGMYMYAGSAVTRRNSSGNSSYGVSAALNDNLWSIMRHKYNETHAGHTCTVNGSNRFTGGSTSGTLTGTATDSVYLGGRSTGGSFPLNGDVFAFIIFNTATADSITDKVLRKLRLETAIY